MTKVIQPKNDDTRPGGRLRPLIAWPTYPVRVVRTRRASVSWGLDATLVPTYLDHLRRLRLKDPTQASDHWRRAQELHEAARAARPQDARADLAARLAAGEITAEEARLAADGQPDRAAIMQAAREHRATLEAGRNKALLAALQALYDFGEDAWLELLRPIVAKALTKGDDDLWRHAHALARWLRDPYRIKVGGLSAAATTARIDAEMYLFAFQRPDLVYRWSAERATDAQRRVLAEYAADGLVRVEYRLRGAPVPKIADFDSTWGAGLYSAAEVVENTAASLAAQEREFAALTRPSAPGPSTRAALAR